MSRELSAEQYIPEWFSLEKYNCCATMNKEAWRCALSDREHIHYLVHNKLNSSHLSGYRRGIESIFIGAITKLGADYSLQPRSYPGPRFDVSFSNEANCVQPLSVNSVFDLAKQTLNIEEASRYSAALQNVIPPDTYLEARQYWDISSSPVDQFLDNGETDYFWAGSHHIHATIDILASEEDLLRSFSKFVEEMKKKYGIDDEQSALLREADFRKYHKHRVLPYIDLTLWFEYKEVSVTHQQMGLILFPDEYHQPLDDRVRRTVKPLADKLMTQDYF